MAEPLRRADDFKLDELPESPNMDVVPPPAPSGSADRTTTAGATQRGDFLLQGDEVDVANRPRHLLEPYSEERERSWPLGRIPGANGAGARIRSITSGIRDGSWLHDIQDRVEEWKARAADWADDAQHSASRLGQRFQSNLSDWQDRAQSASHDIADRSRKRADKVRVQTQRFVNERPAQAVGIAAGVGFVIGVAIRLGRSRREY